MAIITCQRNIIKNITCLTELPTTKRTFFPAKEKIHQEKVNGNNKCYKHYENYYDYEKTLINTNAGVCV